MDPVFLPLANPRLPPGSKLSTYLSSSQMHSGADSTVSCGLVSGGLLSPTHSPLKQLPTNYLSSLPPPSSSSPCRPPTRPLAFTQPPPMAPELAPAGSVSARSGESREAPLYRPSGVLDQARDSMVPSSGTNGAPSATAATSPHYYYKRDVVLKPVLPPGGSVMKQQQQMSGAAVPTSAVAAALVAAPPVSVSREYVADEVRRLLLQQQLETERELFAPLQSELPSEVDHYHRLSALELSPAGSLPVKSSTFGGFVTSCYKATHMHTGQCVCLRRVHGHRLSSTKAVQMVTMWSRVQHTSLVSLRQLFTTKCFGDNSVIFVYDYLPCVETLISRHFSRAPGRSVGTTAAAAAAIGGRYSSTVGTDHSATQFKQPAANVLLAENLLWSYIIQLTGALRVIHGAGLACRVLDPSKVLVSGADRVHLNGCGVLDVLLFDTTSMTNTMSMMSHYQLEDLLNLGKLLLVLACNSLLAIQRDNINTSIGIVERHYSSDLRLLIVNLLMCGSSGSGGAGVTAYRSIADVMPLIGARFYVQLDSCQRLSERLYDELQQAAGSSQLLKLLAKLSVLTERQRVAEPECDVTEEGGTGEQQAGDPLYLPTRQVQAAEDTVLLSLFRHYLFHTVTESGQPFVQLSHVLAALHKLQAGTHDKICLMSGDTLTVLVVTYAELREAFVRAQRRLLPGKHNHQ